MAIVPILYPYVNIYIPTICVCAYILYYVYWYLVVMVVEAATSAIQNDDDILLGAGRGNFFALLYRGNVTFELNNAMSN